MLRAWGTENAWTEGRVIATGKISRDATYQSIAVLLPNDVCVKSPNGDRLAGTIPLVVDYRRTRAFLYWDRVESFELGEQPGLMIHLING